MSADFLQKKSTLVFIGLGIVAAIFFAYSNHFDNAFQFDDAHTIEQNKAIQSIDVVKFFTDGRTFSALPLNQSYRPLTTLENAIDYAWANGLNPRYFHYHIFASFLLCCLLIFVFSKQLTKHVSLQNIWLIALIVTALFGLLCANAETVNYIIQRAEIVSAIFILLGFIFYLRDGFFKRYYLYLLFPLIGFFSKEMAFVFAPLLFVYHLIFSENVDLTKLYKKTEFSKALVAFRKTLPAIILTAGFLVFYSKMLPPTYTSGGLSRFEYLITQPWVICHYIVTYFYPYNLSADTDWTTIKSMTDYRFIVGTIVVLSLLWLSIKASNNKETKPFAFGMLWFFVALLPTSSVVPFSEVLNDHRTFIPYIGLSIAVVFGARYVLGNTLQKKGTQLTVTLIILGFLIANVYGIYQRNKVWNTAETLWKDVTLKSPNNARGMMNYGLALMQKGDYQGAESYFNKTAQLLPGYSYAYINLGILKQTTGDDVMAEKYFSHAILLDSLQHNAWYYYANFLLDHYRYKEALTCLNKVEEISPGFLNTPTNFMQVYNAFAIKKLGELKFDQALNECELALKINPTDEYTLGNVAKIKTYKNRHVNLTAPQDSMNFYVDLSLELYNIGAYEQCIAVANNANQVAPSASAYNNICSAYNQLENYVAAIKACQEAIKLDPKNELVNGNLGYALQHLKN